MRNRSLHDALRSFALEAAALLTDEVAAGAELSFDVVEAPGRRGIALYSYTPRTAEFIADRWHLLRGLPSFAPAAAALGAGAAAYLRLRGETGADSEPALRAMLERLYEDATGFELPEERFERVYGEVERVLHEGSLRATVVAPMRGLALEPERIDLGGGLSLVRGDLVDAPPEAVWTPGASAPNVVCVLERAIESGDELPLDEACDRLLALQTALRLFREGGIAVGPLAWSRADDGAWRSIAIGSPCYPRKAGWLLADGEEGDLLEFLRALGRASQGGAVGWALGRFEMGCERERDIDGLTDHLLGLRALLNAGDHGSRSALPVRVAALCAREDERRGVQARLEHALALESFVISRPATQAAYVDAVGPEPPAELAAEVEEHLRALLSDVLTGHLDRDLGRLADDLLLASGEPLEIEARDLRAAAAPGGAPRVIRAREVVPGEPEPNWGSKAVEEPEPDWEPEAIEEPKPPRPTQRRLRSQLARSYRRMTLAANPPGAAQNERDERSAPDLGEIEPVTTDFEAIAPEGTVAVAEEPEPALAGQLSIEDSEAMEDPEATRDFAAVEDPEAIEDPGAVLELPGAPPGAEADDDPGVTPSSDWDFDEDPDSYSAPV